MKKILLSVITLIYMVLACGVAMEIHYCMGKKAGVELYGSNSDECGLCGMTEKKGGCCHDEHQFYKIDDSHKNVSNDLDLASPFTVAALTYPSYNWQLPQENAAAVEKDHSPPLYSRPPATVLHCVFRL
jgi:hypothetical protein